MSERRRAGWCLLLPGILGAAVCLAWPAAADQPANAATPPAAARTRTQAELGRSGAPVIELLTMSRGETLYARFGHAAMRVTGPRGDSVYNFGYTDFEQEGLILGFLRGRARFWLAKTSLSATLREYLAHRRTVYRHRLTLNLEERRELAAALRRNHRPANRYYVYHHFHDNCATRLRDALDAATGGAVRAQLAGRPTPFSYRELIRRGFAGRPAVLVLAETLVGRAADRPLDRWEAGFLPELLAEYLQQVTHRGRPLVGPARAATLELTDAALSGRPDAGLLVLWALAGLFGLLSAAGLFAIRRAHRSAPLFFAVPLLTFSACGAVIWALAGLTWLPELRFNELALILWPTDAALIFALWRARSRRGLSGWARVYCWAKAAVLVLVGLGHLLGLLYQQPRLWLAIAVVTWTPLWLSVWRFAPPAGPTEANGPHDGDIRGGESGAAAG